MPPSPLTRAQKHSQSLNLGDIKKIIEEAKHDIITTLKSDLDKLNKNVALLNGRVSCMEKTIESITSEVEKCDSEIEKVKESIKNSSEDFIEVILQEVQEMEKRRDNIIISGLKETNEGSVEDRLNHDKECCQDIFRAMNILDVDIQSVRRLGKARDDSKRLMKVQLGKQSDKI